MIDDSGLFHGTYDPAKAREYYLRTRKLTGRKPGTAIEKKSPGRGFTDAQVKAKSRRAELLAQKAALEKRLDRLRDILAKLVKEAKARNDVKPAKKDEKGKAPETQSDKADRNDAEKKRKPLTASQKAAKAKKAKAAYEKEHPNTLSSDLEVLREQVKDIQAKIQKAVADAKDAKKKPNDGPRGR